MDQFGVCPGRTSVMPYSIMARGRDLQQGDLRAERARGARRRGTSSSRCARRSRRRGSRRSTRPSRTPGRSGRAGSTTPWAACSTRSTFFDELAEEGADVGPELRGLVPEGSGRAGRQDAGARRSTSTATPRAAAYGDGNTRVGERRGRDVPAGPVGVRRDREGGPRPRARDVPAAGHRRPRRPQGPRQHRPRRVDPRGLRRTRRRHARSWRTSSSRRSSRRTTSRSWASRRPRTPHPCTDERIVGLKEYIDAGDVYQGASQLVPRAIPIMNYTQAIVLGSDPQRILQQHRRRLRAARLPSAVIRERRSLS